MFKNLITSVSVLALAASLPVSTYAQSTHDVYKAERLDRDIRIAKGALSRLKSSSLEVSRMLAKERLQRFNTGAPYQHPWYPMIIHSDARNGDLSTYFQNGSARPLRQTDEMKFHICVEASALDPEVGLPRNRGTIWILTVFDYDRALVTDREMFQHILGYDSSNIPLDTTFMLLDERTKRFRDTLTGTTRFISDLTGTCFNGYSFGTNSERLALLRQVRVNDVLSRVPRKKWVNAPLEACPPAEHPDKVISTTYGTAISQQRLALELTYYSTPSGRDKWLDTNGDFVGDILAPFNPVDTKYARGCRAPFERKINVRQHCTRTVAGRANDSMRSYYNIPGIEVPPAKGYYNKGEARQIVPTVHPSDWLSTPGVTVDERFCDGAGVLPTPDPTHTNTRSATTRESETLTCASVYPGFPDGTYVRGREKTETEVTYAVLNNPDATQTIISYGDWETQTNTCSATTSGTSSETRPNPTLPCITESRSVTTTTTTFADGRANIVNASPGSWSTVTSTCASSGLSGSGGSSGGGHDGITGYDVDGDGIADTNSYQDALDAAGGDSSQIDTVNNCGHDCLTSDVFDLVDKVDEANNKPSSTQSGSGSSSGGGWGSVGDFFSNLFGGGSSSSSSSSSSGGGGDSGGGGSSDCFAAGTEITMADGSLKAIEDIQIGDEIKAGGTVLATLQFLPEEMFDLNGVHVSGGHLVAWKGIWTKVRDHPEARSLGLGRGFIYNLATEHNRIVAGDLLFNDYTEAPESYVEERLSTTAAQEVARINQAFARGNYS